MLSSTWTLEDVDDVEGLCGKVLDEALRKWGATLREDDREEAMAHLLARSWWLYQRFDPWHEATHRRSFSTFLYRRLRFAVVDSYRLRFGDSHYRDDVVVLSLGYDAGGELNRLDELVPDQEGDPADSCIDLGRILAG